MPGAKPRQVFAYVNHGDGHVTLTLVSAATKEPFPKGSLRKHLTRENNAELSVLARGGIDSPSA